MFWFRVSPDPYEPKTMSSDLSALPAPATELAPLTGHCSCGGVEFVAKGPIRFNVLCHCRSCSRARGVSPVHLLAVSEDGESFTLTRGAELLKTYVMLKTPGNTRNMTFTFCTGCGTHIYQRPEGAPFFAMFPLNFRIANVDNPSFKEGENSEKNCLLPKELWPRLHLNYENRLKDWDDSLPKYQTFRNGPECENDGTVKQ